MMMLEYVIVAIVTLGITLGIIFAKYTMNTRYGTETSSPTGISSGSEEINDFIIDETKHRIDQELENVSADELKGNVLAAISVVFAILSLSEFLKIYPILIEKSIWIGNVMMLISIIVLFVSFLFGIKVLYPRKRRFNLWTPRKTNNSLVKKKYDNINQFKEEFKKELIDNFESIKESRTKDRFFLTRGYFLLIGGSLISFINLLLIHILWL